LQRLVRVFVQQPDDKVRVITKFSLVDKRHAVRTGTQLVGNVSFVWKVRVQNVIGAV